MCAPARRSASSSPAAPLLRRPAMPPCRAPSPACRGSARTPRGSGGSATPSAACRQLQRTLLAPGPRFGGGPPARGRRTKCRREANTRLPAPRRAARERGDGSGGGGDSALLRPPPLSVAKNPSCHANYRPECRRKGVRREGGVARAVERRRDAQQRTVRAPTRVRRRGTSPTTQRRNARRGLTPAPAVAAGSSKYNPIWQFGYTVRGQQCNMRFTSVSGHLHVRRRARRPFRRRSGRRARELTRLPPPPHAQRSPAAGDGLSGQPARLEQLPARRAA